MLEPDCGATLYGLACDTHLFAFSVGFFHTPQGVIAVTSSNTRHDLLARTHTKIDVLAIEQVARPNMLQSYR